MNNEIKAIQARARLRNLNPYYKYAFWAKKLGVSKSLITNWMCYTREMRADKIDRLLEFIK